VYIRAMVMYVELHRVGTSVMSRRHGPSCGTLANFQIDTLCSEWLKWSISFRPFVTNARADGFLFRSG